MHPGLRSLLLLLALAALAGGGFFAYRAAGFRAAAPAPAKLSWPLWNGTDTPEAYAKAVGLEPKDTLDLGECVTLELVLVPAGVFTMGSPESEAGRGYNEPQSRVTIARPFYLGRTEVTQAQYERVAGANPSEFHGSDRPVDSVSWHEAQKFCATLSSRTGRDVRLPGEAEWEFACRAGTSTRFYTGDRDEDLAAAGWYVDNADERSQPVRVKGPNAFGLYDMHGNVAEWCAADPAVMDPRNYRPRRGGAWTYAAGNCRSAARSEDPSDMRHNAAGFRVAVGTARPPQGLGREDGK